MLIFKETNKTFFINKGEVECFNSLSKDRVFLEEEKPNMKKWFQGIGLSVAIGKYLR